MSPRDEFVALASRQVSHTADVAIRYRANRESRGFDTRGIAYGHGDACAEAFDAGAPHPDRIARGRARADAAGRERFHEYAQLRGRLG